MSNTATSTAVRIRPETHEKLTQLARIQRRKFGEVVAILVDQEYEAAQNNTQKNASTSFRR